MRKSAERLLLLDTCGEAAGVALSAAEVVLAKESLLRGTGSADIVSAVQRVLEASSLALAELDAIGVVSGPGSFTGVRVGMAAAKGLSEATGLRMITVSRLLVLSEAAQLTDGLVVLDAGRDECYAMELQSGVKGAEWLGSLEDLVTKAHGREVVVAEEKLMAKLGELAPRPKVRLHSLQIDDALSPLLRTYREQGDTLVLADANYLRGESDIYKKNVAGGV